MSDSWTHQRGEAWRGELQRIARWVLQMRKDGGGVQFGHIEGPIASGKTRLVPQLLWEAVVADSPRNLVVHAVNQRDAGVLYELREESTLSQTDEGPMRFPLQTIGYGGVVASMQINQGRVQNDFTVDALVELGQWRDSGRLPLDVVFVIDLDLAMDVELCLALLGIVEWSFRMLEPGRSTTILTRSSSPCPDFMTGLARMRVKEHPSLFSLPDHAPQSPEKIPRAVMSPEESASAPQSTSRVFLCFSRDQADSITTAVLAKCWERNAGELALSRIDLLNTKASWPVKISPESLGGCNILVLLLPADVGNPTELAGWGEVHIVLAKTDDMMTMDKFSGRYQETPVQTTLEERRRQLSWATRAGCDDVRVYVDASGCAIFLRDGLKENLHALEQKPTAGLIAAMVDVCSRRQVDVADYLWLFINATGPVETAVRWLAARSIICCGSRNGHRVRRGSGAMERLNLPVFFDVLPLVNYDAEIALLLALGSASTRLTHAKVTLATVMTAGLQKLFVFRKGGGLNHAAVARRCRGMFTLLVDDGSIWVFAGLRDAVLKSGMYEDDLDSWPEKRIAIAHSRQVFYDRAVGLSVFRTRSSLASALSSHGISMTDESDMRPLSEEESNAIREDVIEAFISKLCLMESATTLWTVQGALSLSAWADADFTTNEMARRCAEARDVEKVALGLCIDIYRRPTTFSFQDFTWLPSSLVREWWRREQAAGRSVDCEYP